MYVYIYIYIYMYTYMIARPVSQVRTTLSLPRRTLGGKSRSDLLMVSYIDRYTCIYIYVYIYIYIYICVTDTHL